MKLLHTIRQLQKWGIFHTGVPPSWSEKKISFKQNIRTSEHAPAFRMKLPASFIIPRANFLSYITNRQILGFLPLPEKLFAMLTDLTDSSAAHAIRLHVSFTLASRTRHLDLGPCMHQQALSRLHVCSS